MMYALEVTSRKVTVAIESNDRLEREEWHFSYLYYRHESVTLDLRYSALCKRASTRHKFRATGVWDFYDHRASVSDPPSIPEAVSEFAKTAFLANLSTELVVTGPREGIPTT